MKVSELLVALNKVLCGELRERAERLILELAHPKYILSGEVGSFIAEMQAEISKRYTMDPGEPYRICQELLQRAVEMIVQLSREKVVSGTIRGGVLSLDELPEGVTVDIRDYDTEGGDEHDLQEDGHGSHFQAG